MAKPKSPIRVFSKIRYDGKDLELHWADPVKPMIDVEHTLTSKAAPAPEFIKAMKSFVPFVLEILGLPEAWEHETSVTGISLSEDKDARRGLVMTARKPIIQANNAPVIFNTPYLKEAMKAEEENSVGCWLDGMADALTTVQSAAQRFLDGEQAQTEMDLGGNKLPESDHSEETESYADVLKRGRAEIPKVPGEEPPKRGPGPNP